MNEIKLRPRWKAFADEYLSNGFNATAAARAKVCKPGATDAACEKAGWRLSNNVQVAAYISQRLEAAELSSAKILARLSEQALADIGEFITVNPDRTWTIDIPKALDAHKTHLIKRINISKVNGLTIEMVDSQAALITLAKKQKLLSDTAEVNHKVTLSDEIEALLDKRFGNGNNG